MGHIRSVSHQAAQTCERGQQSKLKRNPNHTRKQLQPTTTINPYPSPITPPLTPTPPNSHQYQPEELAKEEANYVYRYSYNGVGESTAWCGCSGGLGGWAVGVWGGWAIGGWGLR